MPQFELSEEFANDLSHRIAGERKRPGGFSAAAAPAAGAGRRGQNGKYFAQSGPCGRLSSGAPLTPRWMDDNSTRLLLGLQRDECTSCEVYRRLAASERNAGRREVLLRLMQDEARHCALLRSRTGCEVAPDRRRVVTYVWISRILGPTFVVRLLEQGERMAERLYLRCADGEEFRRIAREERQHGEALTLLAAGTPLSYISSVVLGLNDALVEFTGALAGFTLALNDARIVALTGSITGIAAALSMAASEYLSTKSARNPEKRPLRAAVCTGIAYIITVAVLVLPYILFTRAVVALGVMLLAALGIIALFNGYYAVVRRERFRRRFLEMAVLSFSIAGISFLIGYLLKALTGINI